MELQANVVAKSRGNESNSRRSNKASTPPKLINCLISVGWDASEFDMIAFTNFVCRDKY